MIRVNSHKCRVYVKICSLSTAIVKSPLSGKKFELYLKPPQNFSLKRYTPHDENPKPITVHISIYRAKFYTPLLDSVHLQTSDGPNASFGTALGFEGQIPLAAKPFTIFADSLAISIQTERHNRKKLEWLIVHPVSDIYSPVFRNFDFIEPKNVLRK